MSELDPSVSEVQLATTADLPQLFKLLEEANKLAVEKTGLPGWKNIEAAHEDIEKHLEASDVFVVRNPDGYIYATLTLSETSDDWGGTGQDGTALYFTKYMKDKDKAQTGDPKKLLKFAANEAQRRNKAVIRCDAVEDQEGIVSHYKDDLGFTEKGRLIYESSGRVGILLENSTQDFGERVDSLVIGD